MSHIIKLASSVAHLYESLIGEESFSKRALYLCFYVQFRTDKKVDFEPTELCKFVFWKKSPGLNIQGFFSDDTLMDQIRTRRRTLGEKSIFLHCSSWCKIGEVVTSRLEQLVETISIKKEVPFFIESITLNKVFIFDLTPEQFSGEISLSSHSYWEWDNVQKKFFEVEVKNLKKVTFLS
jgi:hypothetical protein